MNGTFAAIALGDRIAAAHRRSPLCDALWWLRTEPPEPRAAFVARMRVRWALRPEPWGELEVVAGAAWDAWAAGRFVPTAARWWAPCRVGVA